MKEPQRFYYPAYKNHYQMFSRASCKKVAWIFRMDSDLIENFNLMIIYSSKSSTRKYSLSLDNLSQKALKFSLGIILWNQCILTTCHLNLDRFKACDFSSFRITLTGTLLSIYNINKFADFYKKLTWILTASFTFRS